MGQDLRGSRSDSDADHQFVSEPFLTICLGLLSLAVYLSVGNIPIKS